MSDVPKLSDIVRAALLGRESDAITALLPDGVERVGEWWSLNPSRADVHLGSFSVSLHGERAGCWHDFASGDSGDLFDLVRLVTGCDFSGAVRWLARFLGINAPDPRLTIRRPSAAVVAGWKLRESSGVMRGRGCTVAQLAEAKHLPEDFLRGQGLRDLPARAESAERSAYPATVMIPYERHGDVLATRFRSDVCAKLGSFWKRGDKPIPYGLDGLAGDEDRVLLVEGESDVWTLRFAGMFNAIGIPGASMWRDEWSKSFPRHAEIIVLQEPDAAGAALVEKLKKSPLAARLRVAHLLAKDPAELWGAL